MEGVNGEMTEEEVAAVVEEVEVVCCGQPVDASLDAISFGTKFC